MPIQRARYYVKSAPLNSDWGYTVACEKWGREIVDRFPRFKRGKNVGQLKGYVSWMKVEVGGWARNSPLFGGKAGVLTPGTYYWRIMLSHPEADPQEHSLVARWFYRKGTDPLVELLQSPEEAEKLFSTYGTNKRYG